MTTTCRSNAAEVIKSTLSMEDVAQRYGYEPNRSGFISCPFHSEDTPSLKIYAEPGRGFHCFGCGAGGSVIDFVMKLYDISFPQAVVRLNADFGLGLTSERPDRRAVDRLRRGREKEAAEQKAYRDQYDAMSRLHRELWQARRDLAPKTTDEPLHPLFARALRELDKVENWLAENHYR